MPSYATLADLADRVEERELVELTDDARAGLVDEARVDRALDAADRTIDGYVGSRYRLPLPAAAAAQLVDVACQLARFNLYRTAPPESVANANKTAIERLRAVASGAFKLDVGTEESPLQPDMMIVSGSERLFSRDTMAGF